MKLRVKDSASSKRVVVTLDDNSCVFGQLISEIAYGLNIARLVICIYAQYTNAD